MMSSIDDADYHPHAHVTIEDEDAEYFGAPLTNVRAGRLYFSAGVAPHVIVRGQHGIAELFHARFERPVPDVHVSGGTVSVRYRHFPFSRGFWSERPGEILLNTTLPWTIEIWGGASKLDADLTDIDLAGLNVTGGLSKVNVMLPPPKGIVPITMTGGVSHLTLRRPRGTEIRVTVNGGAAGLSLDDSYFGAIGGETRWQTPGFVDAEDRYELMINGGASKVTLERYRVIDSPQSEARATTSDEPTTNDQP